MADSTAKKPDRPYDGFPLFPHANGQWAKKVRGRTRFFGVWADPEAAVSLWQEQQADLLAGREPRQRSECITVRDLLNEFRASKELQHEAGELSERTYEEYVDTCDLIAAEIGLSIAVSDLRQQDFQRLRSAMASRWGPTRLGNEIQRVRSVFKFAYETELISTPMNYGQHFRRPSKRSQRIARSQRGDRTLRQEDLRKLIDSANKRLKPMILLGINGGFGIKDCIGLPTDAVDLDNRWVDYARVKTGVPRRFPLWPETESAIREWMAKRPKSMCGCLFVNRNGDPDSTHHNVAHQFSRLAKKLGIARSFYDLRRTFQTIGEEAGETATKAIMGHAPDDCDMAAVYRQRVQDSRLQSVTDHVHKWLFVVVRESE